VQNLKELSAVPVVKWVGGKRQLQGKIVPNLTKVLSINNTYFEPFLGGGAIFFGLQPANAFLSDINAGLINLYENIRDQVELFLEATEQIEKSYNSLGAEEKESFFYKVRENYNKSKRTGLSQAVNFLYLNKAGFNGIYRENLNGAFNVPFGRKAKISLGEESNFRSVSEIFKTVVLENKPFEVLADKVKPGDLVYFDPPYVPLSETSAFTSYSAGGFGMKEQIQLRDLFVQLDKAGVNVVMSNSSAPVIRDELYKGYAFTEIQASRNVSASARGRAAVTELIVSNFDFV
jgi:DNA adenine methylase